MVAATSASHRFGVTLSPKPMLHPFTACTFVFILEAPANMPYRLSNPDEEPLSVDKSDLAVGLDFLQSSEILMINPKYK